MKQIEIEMVGAEAAEARLESTRDAVSRHLIGLHLGNQIDAVALAGDHLFQELLGATVAVISGRIDQRHAERNACTDRFFLDSLGMPALTEMPAALAEGRDGGAVRKLY